MHTQRWVDLYIETPVEVGVICPGRGPGNDERCLRAGHSHSPFYIQWSLGRCGGITHETLETT